MIYSQETRFPLFLVYSQEVRLSTARTTLSGRVFCPRIMESSEKEITELPFSVCREEEYALADTSEEGKLLRSFTTKP